MNKALNEFLEKSINYDWAALAQLAKDHYNPEQLINDIYSNGFEDGAIESYAEGVLDGKSEMVIKITKIGVPIIALGAYGLWNKHNKSKKEIDRLLAENEKLKAEMYIKEVGNLTSSEDFVSNVIPINCGSKLEYKKFVI